MCARAASAAKPRGRTFELVTGSVLVGFPGDEYVCTHDHHVLWRRVPVVLSGAGTGRDDRRPSVRRGGFERRAAIARIDGARRTGAGRSQRPSAISALTKSGISLPAALSEDGIGTGRASRSRSRAAIAAGRSKPRTWIETNQHRQIDLDASTANHVGVGPFATFCGCLPGCSGSRRTNYLVRSRLRHAARLLTGEETAITDIAYDVGFADLSNFVRTFHRAAGHLAESLPRGGAEESSKIFQARASALH